ncbi:hypothetical protein GCM10010172_49030 [Paractinoplanes ferrugineus]|uniref:DUF2993 family protein n=1 Tax=Paractinoplanes ferrugineus TaxID=113564 RepID=A0A919JA77_9ACTN|nr:DUF2993 domain-containing protein [Actinoplanes ferrugineus]GIE16152.1 hypothetical protein Afe05nite_79920 [Actinoplanes ferrugineus]
MLIAIGVVAALMVPVAADRAAATVIEHRVAARLRCAADLRAAPDVSLGGFPALTQLASRSFGEIRVQADDVALPKVTIGRVEAEAERVTMAGNGVSAGSVTVDATVPYAALTGLSGATDTGGAGATGVGSGAGTARIVGADDAGRLVLRADLALRGLELAATVYADVTLAGSRLAVKPAEVELASLGLRVPADRLPAAASQERDIDLPALPAGLAYRSVTPGRDGLRVVAGGSDLHLDATAKTKNETCGGVR